MKPAKPVRTPPPAAAQAERPKLTAAQLDPSKRDVAYLDAAINGDDAHLNPTQRVVLPSLKKAVEERKAMVARIRELEQEALRIRGLAAEAEGRINALSGTIFDLATAGGSHE